MPHDAEQQPGHRVGGTITVIGVAVIAKVGILIASFWLVTRDRQSGLEALKFG